MPTEEIIKGIERGYDRVMKDEFIKKGATLQSSEMAVKIAEFIEASKQQEAVELKLLKLYWQELDKLTKIVEKQNELIGKQDKAIRYLEVNLKYLEVNL